MRHVSARRRNRQLIDDEENSIFSSCVEEVLGVYRNTYNISLNIQNNLPVFATIIEANYISTRDDKISFETLTDEDVQEIQRLSKDPKIAQRVYASIAPSIYGHEMVKKAIAFAMFGGEPKNPGMYYSTGTQIDGETIEVLMNSSLCSLRCCRHV